MNIEKYSDYLNLKIIHIFIYYDFPLFFISQSHEGHYFLNYYVEEIENGFDKWLFGRISDKERTALIQQRLSTLKLLDKLYKGKRLYHLYINPLLKESKVPLESELVNQENFDRESFPQNDFLVSFDYVTNKKLTKVEEELIDSSQFKMVLKDAMNSHDIGLDIFLNVLNNLKKSINDIANDIGNQLIGGDSSHSVNLRIDSLQPSSFGIWLKTEPLDTDLFEVPEKSLNNLFKFIGDIQYKKLEEIEEQIEIDKDYSLETIKSVKNMLKGIVENEFSLKLEGATKIEKKSREVKFDKDSYNKLDMLIHLLSKKSENYTEIIDIEGILTSVNSVNNHFKISTINIGDISGKMSKEIFNKMKHEQSLKFSVPSMIKATVEKEVKKDYVEGEFSEKYTLIHFRQPE